MEPLSPLTRSRLSLAERLSQVPDRRQQSKVEHPLVALLLPPSSVGRHALLAVLSGCRGPTAIAQWGRLHPELAEELGYPNATTPCAASLTRSRRSICRVFADLAWESLVAGTWAEAWIQENVLPSTGLALDGKTYRGSRKRGGRNCFLPVRSVVVLTAVFHEIGLTLGEAAVDDKTNEIPVAKAMS